MDNRAHLINVDYFPCGCLVTSRDKKILFANAFFEDSLGWALQDLLDQNINILLSRASSLYLDSYIAPTVFKEGRCCESNLNLLDASGSRFPKVVSVRLMPDGNLTWIFVEAEKRDLLFQELEDARMVLQKQKDQLEKLSMTDGLTGIANRRAFDSAIERAFGEAERSGLPVSILMMDLDNFKQINDKSGHQVGDMVLSNFANVLDACCREFDTAARFGGDEFACILLNTTLNEACEVARRIQSAVATLKIAGHSVSISIGAACRTSADPLSVSRTLQRADAALYDAKNAGRNAVFVWEPKK